jgi:hypothetical protein
MIEIKKAFQGITEDELNHLLDAPVWLSLLAALANDGVIEPAEKAEAIKLAHLRSFTSPKSLREFYEQVDARFEKRFDAFVARLPEGKEDREVYIEAQIKVMHAILPKLDEDIASSLEESLESFYKRIFNSEKSFFQYFALPVFSSRLDKNSGNYDV